MRLSERSEKRLAGVHPDLVKVLKAAVESLDFEVAVTEGVRTKARQTELYAQGRTKPGKIVTWSMASRHLTGHAVDLVPLQDDGSIDWNDKDRFFEIGSAMREESIRSGIPVRWGYDWDGDGVLNEKGEYDGPHFELARSKYP